MPQDQINEEDQLLKKIIKDTVDGICLKKIITFTNICAVASRSASDRDKIINDVFSLMTDSILPMELDTALASVDSGLEGGFGE